MMTGVQRIVDDVRARLEAHDQTLNDQLRLLASEYATACIDAEARLRRCEELVRTGYYGEALYLAELDPPLLEVMSVLSFPERKAWGELVGMYGLPEAPPLSRGRATELNRVYSDYATIEPLVKRLRHLNRKRAPQAERAAVLRELCAADKNCPLWGQQLEELENAVRTEMIRSLENDLRNGDRSRVFEYYAALSAPGWRRPATPAVIAKAAFACLPRLLSRLSTAVSREDLQAARKERAELERVARDAMLIPGDPVTERVATVLADVDRMESRIDRGRERERALEAFRDAVYRGAAEEELTLAYDRARELGAKIPRPLVDQYHSRLTKHESKREVRQAVIGIVAIVFGAIVLIAFLVLITRR